MIEKNMEKYSCILSMTDDTIAVGWLCKSNLQESEKKGETMTAAIPKMAREHVVFLIEPMCKLNITGGNYAYGPYLYPWHFA